MVTRKNPFFRLATAHPGAPFTATKVVALLVILACPAATDAAPLPGERTPDQSRYRVSSAAETPYITFKVHRIGNLGLNISNTGYLGDRRDFCTGLPVPSLEFPINSGVEYNYAGGIWVGAVSRGDTLVSLAITGGSGVGAEYFPRKFPEGDILERTTRPIFRQPANSNCPDVRFSEDAVSEQDFVAVYCDTLGEDLGLGGEETGEHRPLGIQVTQKSYSWSTEYARDFVLIEMSIENVGADTLKQLYMGIFMDQDVFGPGGTYDDDITGFTHSVPSPVGHGYRDTLNLAWIADNDGDPRGARYESWMATGVTGLRVVQAPGNLQFAFNWWISNSTTARDWGPNRRDSKVTFVNGNLGTPGSDLEHYAIMSNGEFDYPQWEAAIDHSLEGWLPPVQNPSLAADLANGFDTRYLLSFGPFEVMPPDSVLKLTFAVIAGESFHVDPQNYVRYFDAYDPAPWLANLNQDDFSLNALWAGWVYDSPGYDTDGDGYRGKYRVVDGDTAFYTGDGVADYQGPPPPPAPSELKYETEAGKITIRWNGRDSETRRDPFSFIPDFEGYRVYISRTLQLADFAMLASRDNINFVRKIYERASNRWKVTDPPYTLDSLQIMYNGLVQGEFHPDNYKLCDTAEALMEIVLDPNDPSKLDTSLYCFDRFESNYKVNDTTTAYQVDSLGQKVVQVIRKVYPYAEPDDSLLFLPDGTVVEWPYYEYEFAIDGLQLAEPVFLAVTTFDFGNPAADLSPLESSPLANATEIWPINSAAVVNSTRPTPGVYPNPYRLADSYNENRWENPRNLEPDAERSRKVTFTNIPDTCTISIWSLDGDLVRQLDHAKDPGTSEATVAVWNLITRNTQAVKTGLYIYTVESRFGTDIGKLVIIK